MDEKELYSIFSKALFPSGNINIEDIINDVTKENNKKPEEENKVIIDSPKPYNNIEPKKTRKELRQELKKPSNKKTILKAKERKQSQLKEIEDKFNKIKLEVKAEKTSSLFSDEDRKRIQRVLFQK